MPSTNQTGIDVEAWAKDIKEQSYAQCVVCAKKIHGDAFEEISLKFAQHVIMKHDPEGNASPIPLFPPL